MKEIHGQIKNGNFIPHKEFEYINALNSYEGQNVNMKIIAHRESVSYRQHKYYRGAIVAFVCKYYTKMSTERLHKFFQNLFLKRTDKLGDYTFSTADLNTKQMATFTDRVCMYLKSPDNELKQSIHIATSEEYFEMLADGTWEL